MRVRLAPKTSDDKGNSKFTDAQRRASASYFRLVAIRSGLSYSDIDSLAGASDGTFGKCARGERIPTLYMLLKYSKIPNFDIDEYLSKIM